MCIPQVTISGITCTFTIETEEPELPEAIELLGADRFIFATDYPHNDPGRSMKWRNVELMHGNDRINPADKQLMLHHNAEALFGTVAPAARAVPSS